MLYFSKYIGLLKASIRVHGYSNNSSGSFELCFVIQIGDRVDRRKIKSPLQNESKARQAHANEMSSVLQRVQQMNKGKKKMIKSRISSVQVVNYRFLSLPWIPYSSSAAVRKWRTPFWYFRVQARGREMLQRQVPETVRSSKWRINRRIKEQESSCLLYWQVLKL